MMALSILQPWAWLIVRPDLVSDEARFTAALLGQIKDIENRSWATRFRGRFLVHAGKRWGPEQREDLERVREQFPHIAMPDTFDRGGIVGAADLVDCVSRSDSTWFVGEHGFVLANQRPAPRFIPWKGRLGFFEIPRAAFAGVTP